MDADELDPGLCSCRNDEVSEDGVEDEPAGLAIDAATTPINPD